MEQHLVSGPGSPLPQPGGDMQDPVMEFAVGPPQRLAVEGLPDEERMVAPLRSLLLEEPRDATPGRPHDHLTTVLTCQGVPPSQSSGRSDLVEMINGCRVVVQDLAP